MISKLIKLALRRPDALATSDWYAETMPYTFPIWECDKELEGLYRDQGVEDLQRLDFYY